MSAETSEGKPSPHSSASFTQLPDELIEQIFKHITEGKSYMENIATLSRASQVSRTLSRVALGVLYRYERALDEPHTLFHGMRTGNLRMVQESIRFGWSPIEIITLYRASSQDIRRLRGIDINLLGLAAMFGHVNIIKFLIESGVDASTGKYRSNYHPEQGRSMPRFAVDSGYLPRFAEQQQPRRPELQVWREKCWPQAGGFPYRCDIPNIALDLAIKRGWDDAAAYLLQSGADATGRTVSLATANGATKALQLLLKYKPMDTLSSTLSSASFSHHSVKVFTMLLEHGADPNLYEPSRSVLWRACEVAHTEAAHLLLDYGAQPVLCDGHSGQYLLETCLLLPRRLREVSQLIERMIPMGLDVTCPMGGRGENRSPLFAHCLKWFQNIAAEGTYYRGLRSLDVARVLLKHGASMDVPSRHLSQYQLRKLGLETRTLLPKRKAIKTDLYNSNETGSVFWFISLVRHLFDLCELVRGYGAPVPQTDDEIKQTLLMAFFATRTRLEVVQKAGFRIHIADLPQTPISFVVSNAIDSGNMKDETPDYKPDILKYFSSIAPRDCFLFRKEERETWFREHGLIHLIKEQTSKASLDALSAGQTTQEEELDAISAGQTTQGEDVDPATVSDTSMSLYWVRRP